MLTMNPCAACCTGRADPRTAVICHHSTRPVISRPTASRNAHLPSNGSWIGASQ